MTNEAAFLQAILAEPEEDLLRLLFADWLEEQGDPRADFIRVQCALARLAEEDPRRNELLQQQRDLWALHGEEWARPLAGLVRKYCFRRGFVEEIGLELEAFLDHGEELCGQFPIQQIDLEGGVRDQVDEDDLRALADSPHLGRVRELNLASMYLNADAMLVLATSPYLTQLTRLNLNRNVISDDGVRALAAASHLEQLTALELASNLIGDAGVQALAASKGWPRLSTLNLRGNSIGDAGVQALAASPLLAR
ncbi:MAG: TIGR02996 domain-containing protein, partial [Planctomycetes bacterium]|nr:TIGR02996 domain-containing protein [Planctomycetota bacterium]